MKLGTTRDPENLLRRVKPDLMINLSEELGFSLDLCKGQRAPFPWPSLFFANVAVVQCNLDRFFRKHLIAKVTFVSTVGTNELPYSW